MLDTNTNTNTIEIQIEIQIDEDVFICRGVTYRLVVGALGWRLPTIPQIL